MNIVLGRKTDASVKLYSAKGLKDKVEDAAEELGRKLGKAYKQAKSKLTSTGTEVKNKVEDFAEDLGHKAGKTYKQAKRKLSPKKETFKDKVGDVADELGYKLGKAKKWVERNPGKSAAIGAGTAAVAGGLGYVAYKHHKDKKNGEK